MPLDTSDYEKCPCGGLISQARGPRLGRCHTCGTDPWVDHILGLDFSPDDGLVRFVNVPLDDLQARLRDLKARRDADTRAIAPTLDGLMRAATIGEVS